MRDGLSSGDETKLPNGLPITRAAWRDQESVRADTSFQNADNLVDAQRRRVHPTIMAGHDSRPENPFVGGVLRMGGLGRKLVSQIIGTS